MATTRTLINKVLRGIRQFGMLIDNGTTSTTDDYLLMILQFVNEAKAEIEESGWCWRALRQTVTVTINSAQVQYDLLSSADADVDTNDRTRLLYTRSDTSEGFRDGMSSVPQVFDVTTSSIYRLREITQEGMEALHFEDAGQTGKPEYFTLWNDGDSLQMKVWPTPDGTYTLKMRFYIPQADLDETNLDGVISVPSRPVWTKALFKANEERGSELGKPGSSCYMAYLDAHGAAVAAEMTAADETVTLER